MDILKANEVLLSVQNMINAISDPDEIEGIRVELAKLEKHFQDILKYQIQLDNSGDNFEKDDITRSYLPEEFNGDITIPRYFITLLFKKLY